MTKIYRSSFSDQKPKMLRERPADQCNVKFDPEFAALGMEMAAFHIEAGSRGFADLAHHMVQDLGFRVVPYLRSFYKAARSMPGMEELAQKMDTDQYVDAFNLDKFLQVTRLKSNFEK